jgi:hypothetical protein
MKNFFLTILLGITSTLFIQAIIKTEWFQQGREEVTRWFNFGKDKLKK